MTWAIRFSCMWALNFWRNVNEVSKVIMKKAIWRVGKMALFISSHF
ncbi:hypothetical protein PULV_a0268 [Pseudoalteromonas ulvae UL12]|nr:hypothetical protein [Pseudoalteromonas ulvae UL12]